ncbi:MAG: prepilin-type N-terminal cleavage/methylation domain-containing protein [Clostridium sp.]|nr:prepilin-type N-terminal cleavage/methylation domain-containing protein [Clostridium sp.]
MMGQSGDKDEQGFTLAELLVVVAIIAVLVAISVPIFMKKMDHTKSTVCEANRKILLREMLLTQMEDDGFSQTDAEAILAKSDAYCPAGGNYTVTWDESYIKVSCDLHGASVGGAEEERNIKVTDQFIDDYRSFTIQYLKDNPHKSNDDIRKAFLEKYNGKWPTLTTNGKSYSIQPFYQGSDRTKPVEKCVWLFARTDESSSAGWSVPYVYNVVDNKWYGATKWDGTPGGSANISYSDIDSLDEAIRNGTHSNGKKQWIEVKDYKESE